MMPTLRKLTLTNRLHIARKAAMAAARVIMAHYGKTITVRTKSSPVDLVTQVDEEADALIRDIIQQEAPDERLITEESFEPGSENDLRQAWIVDPLDGTTNYAHSFPHFAVSIAYVEEGKPKIAVVYDPFKNELYTATQDEPTMRNGRAFSVSDTADLQRALLATGFPYDLQGQDNLHNNVELHARFLQKTHGIRRAGSAALDLAYVACGRLDGFWEMRLAPWDVAAGALLIEKAGGKVTDFQGQALNLAQRHIQIVGSNTHLHASLIDTTQAF